MCACVSISELPGPFGHKKKNVPWTREREGGNKVGGEGRTGGGQKGFWRDGQ